MAIESIHASTAHLVEDIVLTCENGSYFYRGYLSPVQDSWDELAENAIRYYLGYCHIQDDNQVLAWVITEELREKVANLFQERYGEE